jgi:hypothetical protein
MPFSICYDAFRAIWVRRIVNLGHWEWINMIRALATAAAIISGCMGLFHFFRGSRNAIRNVTAVEVFKTPNLTEFDRGCIPNCEEICGPGWLLPCWLFPCFSGLEDGLYARYASYSQAPDAPGGLNCFFKRFLFKMSPLIWLSFGVEL